MECPLYAAVLAALAVQSWEGLEALHNGVVIGGDEVRSEDDYDGGAIFRFVPETPYECGGSPVRSGLLCDNTIGDLDGSPLVSGQNYALFHVCSNPNAFNTRQKGGHPVTIFGSATFDVTAIDLDTLQLCTDAAGTDCTPAGIKSYGMVDRGDPGTDIGADACALIDTDGAGVPDTEADYLNPDGFLDLDAVFYAPEVSDLIGDVSKGDVVGPLYLVGYLNDSTPITSVPVYSVGVDHLLIVK